METSRSEMPRAEFEIEGHLLAIPDTATPAETAAMAAAIGSYLATPRSDAGEASPGWQGRRWAFAGRLAELGRSPGRVPGYAPSNPWTASGRADRF